MTIVEMKTDGSRQADVEALPKVQAAQNAKTVHVVADIVAGVNDNGGENIEFVYFERPNYAIYRRGVPPQIVVAYSDDPATADQQIAAISQLLPLRAHLVRAGAGALGAVLSIAIGIRARTVAIEGDWPSNAVDAGVRVGIGMISAGVLFFLLNSGMVAKISAGDVSLTGNKMEWQVALVIGFAAGFLERLVPDLLERTAPPAKPPVVPTAAGAAGMAPPSH